MIGGIAIFVKTPGRSAVKTRLAAAIGTERAEGFHRLAALSVEAAVRGVAGVQGYYAVAEPGEAVADWPGLPSLWQGPGGLGERMATVYSELLRRHRLAFLIGADVPQVTPEAIGRAVMTVADQAAPRYVVAPSPDGGFWLIGGNRPIPRQRWTEVEYSRPTTRLAFMEGLADLGEVVVAETLTDVDEAADLAAVRAALRQTLRPTDAQRRLTSFLEAMDG